MFRRLLSAHEDNQIAVSYHDLETNEKDLSTSCRIWLEYDDDESKKAHEFEVKISNGQRYDVQYEARTLDIDAMTAKRSTSGSPSRKVGIQISISTESKPARIDIYANGRLLMTSVFEDIFDLAPEITNITTSVAFSRGNAEGETSEVPTDNKKTRLDTNSELWRNPRKSIK